MSLALYHIYLFSFLLLSLIIIFTGAEHLQKPLELLWRCRLCKWDLQLH